VLWRNTIAPAYFMFGWNPGVGVKSNRFLLASISKL